MYGQEEDPSLVRTVILWEVEEQEKKKVLKLLGFNARNCPLILAVT